MRGGTYDVSRLLSGLDYHPYLIGMVGLDAEWTRHHGYAKPSEGSEVFESSFQELQKKAFDYCDEHSPGIQQETLPLHDGLTGSEEGVLVPFYHFMNFLPFGHADALGIVLLDDFDPVHFLTARCSTTVEEVTIGFCVKTRKLASSFFSKTGKTLRKEFRDQLALRPTDCKWLCEGDVPRWSKLFVEPHELFDPLPEKKVNYFADEHQSQQQAPLLMFSALKTGGLSCLHFGLWMEEAICRAIALKLIEGLCAIRKNIKAFEGHGISESDIDNMRFSILDLQSQEQFGILFLTNCYSLPMALLSLVQSVTLDDVWKCSSLAVADETFENAYGNSSFFKELAAAFRWAVEESEDKSNEPELTTDRIRSAHVFRWTRTVLGVSPRAYQILRDGSKAAKAKVNIKGKIVGITQFQIPPGHQRHVDQRLTELANDSNRDPGTTAELTGQPFCLHTTGRADLVMDASSFDSRWNDSFLDTSDFILNASAIINSLVTNKDPSRRGRDLVGMSTLASIPVPDVEDFHPDFDFDQHYTPFDVILRVIKSRLPESIGNLEKTGLPVTSYRTLSYLRDNFDTVITNPHQFELVLDLYDVMRTLENLLRTLEPLYPGESRWSKRALKQLSAFLEATQQAMEQRLYRAFPEDRVRDMEIDFRGGLNQLVAGADAVMKCAVGILRHHVLFKGEKISPRNRVAVLKKITFDPGIEIEQLHFGDVGAPQVAVIRTDVPHIHHVPSLIDFWHEAFHLIFDALLKLDASGNNGERFLPSVEAAPATGEVSSSVQRLSEIFVHVLSALFLCKDEPDILINHVLIQYGGSSAAIHPSKADRLIRYLELTLSLFLTKKLLEAPHVEDGEELLPGAYLWEEYAIGSFESMRSEFATFLAEKRQLHWEFREFPDTMQGQVLLDSKVDAFLSDVVPFLGYLYREARSIYDSGREKAIQRLPVSYEDKDKALDTMLDDIASSIAKKGDSEVRPFAFSLPLADGDRLDSTFLICACLRGIMKVRGEATILQMQKEKLPLYVHEIRKDQPHYAGKGFFMRKHGAGSMECFNSAGRSSRLARHIRVLKTCWGIASFLRWERMEEFFKLSRGAYEEE